MSPLFQAGGLASGLDTQSIISSLVQLESRPILQLQRKQDALRSQISAIGEIVSKLSELSKVAERFGSEGVVGTKVTTDNNDFTATSDSTAAPGSYSVRVDDLALAAKARSDAFSSPDDEVKKGKLTLTIDGTAYEIDKNDGDTLQDVTDSINASAAPVTATILFDGTDYFLSVTRTETGHEIGQNPNNALKITETSSGSGSKLDLTITQDAQNAGFRIDGLNMERRTNTITDAIPGVTLQLADTGGTEDLVIAHDLEATEATLQEFADAYNGVMALVRKHLDVTDTTNRERTLAGDASIRTLQSRLRSLLTHEVTGLSDVRALVDAGLKSDRSGTLSVDTSTLQDALGRDPTAINELFSQATAGLTTVVEDTVDLFNDPVDGIFTQRKSSLNDRVGDIDDDIANLELRVDTFRENLVRQFTAMEQVVSGLNAIGGFLTQQFGGA